MLSTTLIVSVTLLPGFFILISYITNSSAFPPQPLSAEEELRYIVAMEHGDEIARNILVERNLRLVAHVVKKFDNTGEDVDDLISIGTIGLIKAINTYDRHQGTRLATYAARCIENEILCICELSNDSAKRFPSMIPSASTKKGMKSFC